MTPLERMEYIMTGSSWDDAEKVGVEILARCMALHAYAREDGEEFFKAVMSRICKRADQWAHEDGNAIALGFARAGYKLEKRMKGCS